MAQKIIIDTDPGIGDALAVGVALFDEELDVVGLTATAGRVTGKKAGRNLQAIVEFLDPPKLPRLGTTSAIGTSFGKSSEDAPFNLAQLDGESGLGDWDFDVADLHRPHDSAKLMVDLVRNHPHEITLLTLGPLTNVELACERAPDFLSLLRGLVCLGGAIKCGGDVTAAAEFNVYANPEAARTILRYPATKTLVPLDVSSSTVLTFEQFNRLVHKETGRLSQLMQKLLPFAFRAHHEFLGEEGIRLHELVALCAIKSPRLFASQSMAVDVETSGELTRGMTVFDLRGVRHWQTNIDVVRDVDAQGTLDYLARIVQARW